MRRLLSLCACLLLAAPGFLAAESPQEAAHARAKSLEGDWTATEERGDGVLAHFSATSNSRGMDTGVFETIRFHDDPTQQLEFRIWSGGISYYEYSHDFTTTYLLHHCDLDWEEAAKDPGRWDFNFRRRSQLVSLRKPQLARLELIFEDADHFTQRWTWRHNGADEIVSLRFTRKNITG